MSMTLLFFSLGSVLALLCLWAFWLAPLVGAALAGVAYPYLFGKHEELADTPVNDDALIDEDEQVIAEPLR